MEVMGEGVLQASDELVAVDGMDHLVRPPGYVTRYSHMLFFCVLIDAGYEGEKGEAHIRLSG